MSVYENYSKLIKGLYEIANPIIKYRIDTEIYEKENVSINLNEPLINYWLNTYKCQENSSLSLFTIHGSKDCIYENSIAKLLEFGLTKDNLKFGKLFEHLLEDENWDDDNSFEGILIRTVMYPFLIRAGYYDNKNVDRYFMNRLQKIETTIEKYGYDFEDKMKRKEKKYENEFVFKFGVFESLPTIYDLYGFVFYPKNNQDISKRIENIVGYLLDERVQRIPQKAYIYDERKKRYYAVGNVYQACMIKQRKLLTIFLLSYFRVASESDFFIEEVRQLLATRDKDGFYEFDKDLLNEKKDCNYIYTGNHMGLGEDRRNKNWRKIESTFWMLKVILNLENNNLRVE